MSIMFHTLLQAAKLPLKDIRLLRHKDKRATKGRTPYELWRDNRPMFELYQSSQNIRNRPKLNAPYWAVFVVNFSDETMFGGIYQVKYQGLWKEDTPMPHIEGGIERAGSCDAYELKLMDVMSDLIGKLFIEWGPGKLAWCQKASKREKPVIELRRDLKEEEFPGFLRFREPVSRLERLPKSWEVALRSTRGVYLLTCPKTREQYVGSATGENGFWGRWLTYAQDGHGGNLGLKSRDPSDYQVAILEVASSSANEEDILKLEGIWQRKLQSREMGLNKNLAG